MRLTSQHLPVLYDKIRRLEDKLTGLEEAYRINKTSSAAASLRRQINRSKEEIKGFKSLVDVIKNRRP